MPCAIECRVGQLLEALLHAIATQGIRRVVLVISADQSRMVGLGTEFGFELAVSPVNSALVLATKTLRPDNGPVTVQV